MNGFIILMFSSGMLVVLCDVCRKSFSDIFMCYFSVAILLLGTCYKGLLFVFEKGLTFILSI